MKIYNEIDTKTLMLLYKILTIGFLVVGIAFFWRGVLIYRFESRIANNPANITGTIQELTNDIPPKIEYKFEVEGKNYIGRSTVTNTRDYHKGDAISIAYAKDNPTISELQDKGETPWLFLMFGSVILVIAAYLVYTWLSVIRSIRRSFTK